MNILDKQGWLTLQEAATALRVKDRATIRRWLKKGKLEGCKPGGTKSSSWLVSAASIKKVLGITESTNQAS